MATPRKPHLSTLTQRKTRKGYCNGCNVYGHLTWDHVPPQGSIDVRPVDVRFWVNHFSQVARHPVNMYEGPGTVKEELDLRHGSQNGLKFYTLCAECNNARLGRRYDPEFNRVSNEVGKAVRAAFEAHLQLPFTIEIHARTHLLLRSVIGHLLAAHCSTDQQQPLRGFDEGFYRNLRDYFLDESLPIPPDIRVYYWPYPSAEQIAITGLGIADRDGGPHVIGDLLKFFPMAFFVANHLSDSLKLNVPFIQGDGCSDLACTVDLLLNMRDTPPTDWPETPTKKLYTIMPIQSSHVAVPRNR